jgi:simple sugar transport system permease protein
MWDSGFLAQTLTAAAPVLLAALGGVWGERSGVINIGLEGLMILGALTAVIVAVVTGSPLLGVLAALLAGSSAPRCSPCSRSPSGATR